MAGSDATYVFLSSLLAIPLIYLANFAIEKTQSNNDVLVLALGSGCLLVVVLVTWFSTKYNQKSKKSWMFTVFSIFTFSSVVDLIIALELDGFIEGFMTFYFNHGEPYLKTAYGTMICYWDAIGHYAMYMVMLSAMSWNQSYRSVSLYWVGSIAHSMIVFMPGNIIGIYGLKWAYALNLPYLVIPFWFGAKQLSKEKNDKLSFDTVSLVQAEHRKSCLRRPADLFFIFYFLTAALIAVIRGFAVLGCPLDITQVYLQQYEPYLTDPGMYGKVQMLVYLFYFLPYYCMSICALVTPGNSWMRDWAIIHAGAAAQAQVTHIGASLHYRTPYILRVPEDPLVRLVFWTINISLLIVPQLFMYRCVKKPEFFYKLPVGERRVGLANGDNPRKDE